MSGCNLKNEEAVCAPANDCVAPADQERLVIFVRYFGNNCARSNVLRKLQEIAKSWRDSGDGADSEAKLAECNQAIRVAREYGIDVPEGIENYSDPD